MRALAILIGALFALFAVTFGAGAAPPSRSHATAAEIRDGCSSGLHAHHHTASVDDDDDDDDDDGDDCDTLSADDLEAPVVEMSAVSSPHTPAPAWAESTLLGPARGHTSLPDKPPRVQA